jgi:probable HAF family extracellular repeat protein
MKNWKIFFRASLAFIFIINSFACAYDNIIDLGILDGYPISNAWFINDSNRVVGWAENDTNDSRACIFDNTGGGANTNLGGSGSGALSGNSSQIVGRSDGNACLFDSTGGGANRNLGTLGGNSGGAQSINSSGQIAGWAWNSSRYERACLFDSSGDANKNMDLKTLGGLESEALSSNSRIVGYADNNSNYERACIFDSTGDSNNNIDLGTLGGDFSLAWSINSNDEIAGWAFDSSGNYHACLFDLEDSNNNVDLGTLGGDFSEAYSINDDGQIAGYAADSSGQPRACLFDPTGSGNNIDLNTRIDPNSGWMLLYAFSINNDGWIAGQGINRSGQTHAFLLIPEPPIRAKIFLCPDTLNLRDNGWWITCFIWLPEGYKVADINPASILLEDEVKAEWTWVDKRCQVMIVKFRRSAVEDIVDAGWVKLTVSGELTNGREFEGTDTIKVIDKCKHKHKCFKWHRRCKR